MATSVLRNNNTRLVLENARWAKTCITYPSAISLVLFFASCIQKLVDRWDKMFNELSRYIEKWNIDVFSFKDMTLIYYIRFSRSYAVYHLQVMIDYWCRK